MDGERGNRRAGTKPRVCRAAGYGVASRHGPPHAGTYNTSVCRGPQCGAPCAEGPSTRESLWYSELQCASTALVPASSQVSTRTICMSTWCIFCLLLCADCLLSYPPCPCRRRLILPRVVNIGVLDPGQGGGAVRGQANGVGNCRYVVRRGDRAPDGRLCGCHDGRHHQQELSQAWLRMKHRYY